MLYTLDEVYQGFVLSGLAPTESASSVIRPNSELSEQSDTQTHRVTHEGIESSVDGTDTQTNLPTTQNEKLDFETTNNKLSMDTSSSAESWVVSLSNTTSVGMQNECKIKTAENVNDRQSLNHCISNQGDTKDNEIRDGTKGLDSLNKMETEAKEVIAVDSKDVASLKLSDDLKLNVAQGGESQGRNVSVLEVSYQPCSKVAGDLLEVYLKGEQADCCLNVNGHVFKTHR